MDGASGWAGTGQRVLPAGDKLGRGGDREDNMSQRENPGRVGLSKRAMPRTNGAARASNALGEKTRF